ncbi:hypothetical protein [Xanthobacter sp. KR7-225]|uniref:hypothetical protein n=1 Tax=Xanthobacter sp. KR7-225 TaxID=3156613 RepID=UPI0032B3C927
MKINLSRMLADLRDSYGAHQHTGITLTAEAVDNLVRGLDCLVHRALVLEEAERQLAEMEAVAADLDVMEARAVAVAAPVPGTNVVLLPLPGRPAEGDGGRA